MSDPNFIRSIDHTPFLDLAEPRVVERRDLPEDLQRFYSRHDGKGLSSSPDPTVRIAKADEVALIAWKDLHVVGEEAPPPGWEAFSGYRIGISTFFDEIVYVQWAPCCERGSILMIGPDVAGPQMKGPTQPEFCLILASTFDDWIERLFKYDWIEYGVVPGERRSLDGAKRKAVTDHFRGLNLGLSWSD